jgi:hypothetical protein
MRTTKSDIPTKTHNHRKGRYAAFLAALAAAAAALPAVISPGPAAAATAPAPLAGGQYAKTLILNDTGAKLASWNQTKPFCSPDPGYLTDGTAKAVSGGRLALTTSGKSGSCVALISPGTVSSGVIESRVYFPPLPGRTSTIANWTGFWLSGPNWPTDGELDASEVEPVDATNAVTWHSGTSADLFSKSTAPYFPPRLPVESPNLAPGWHTVDVVYTKGEFIVYYDGREYTHYASGNVTGRPLNIYYTMTDTPNNSWVVSRIGGPPINTDPKPATFGIQGLRIWTLK